MMTRLATLTTQQRLESILFALVLGGTVGADVLIREMDTWVVWDGRRRAP